MRSSAVLVLAVLVMVVAGCGRSEAPADARDGVDLEGGRTRIVLAPPLAEILGTAGVAVQGVGPATVTRGTARMPIRSGVLDVGPLSGVIRNGGGVAFVADGASIEMRAVEVDLDGGVLRGRLDGRTVVLFDVDLGSARVDEGRRAVVQGARLRLSDALADGFTDLLGIEVLPAGSTAGRLSLVR